jgi:hypothetical protein
MRYTADKFLNDLSFVIKIASKEGIKNAIEKEFGEEVTITDIDEDDGLGYCKTYDGRKLWFKLTKGGKYKTKSLRPDK